MQISICIGDHSKIWMFRGGSDAKEQKKMEIKADAFREKCKVSRFGIIDLFRECEWCGYKNGCVIL